MIPRIDLVEFSESLTYSMNQLNSITNRLTDLETKHF